MTRLAVDHDVIVHYRRDRDAAEAAAEQARSSGARAIVVAAELEDSVEIDRLMDAALTEYGRIDVLVANAASTSFRPVLEAQTHHVTRTLNGVVTSLVHLARRFADHALPGGRIIVISGLDARMAQPGHGVLGAAKAAVESLTRSLAVELGPRGVAVTAIEPGPVETDSLAMYFEGRDAARELLIDHTPIGRFVTPEEIAELVTFLCSRHAGAITGTTITIDGGISAQGGPWRDLAVSP